jgi:hypothetical protein
LGYHNGNLIQDHLQVEIILLVIYYTRVRHCLSLGTRCLKDAKQKYIPKLQVISVPYILPLPES